jgi:hypothetical protein
MHRVKVAPGGKCGIGRAMKNPQNPISAQKRWAALAAFVGVGVGVVALAAPALADTILFVGNSFTFAAYSPVWKYRADTVADLNGGGVGGVPALFKLFTQEAGLNYQVSLETSGGKDLQWHIDQKTPIIDRTWDHVILQSFSTLDAKTPGDATSLVSSAAVLARMFHARNPKVDIRLDATWSRADLTYRPGGHWYGRPIDAMEQDVRAGYDKAAAGSPLIKGVIPVGGAWDRAFQTGFADPNPYDGIGYGKVDLWAFDNYHASTFGYYIEALMMFGAVTGKDPLSLGPKEQAASELGVSPAQAAAMQQIAHDELAARAKP